MKKSVAIVEDDIQLRNQLERILKHASDICFVGAYGSAEEAIPKIVEKEPDVVLMDINLPKMTGIECVAEIKRRRPETQVIMVTVYEDNERIFQALKAGANGYLIKSDSPDQLLDAIRDVSRGGGPMSTSIARKVIQHFHTTDEVAPNSDGLSPREREVLGLLAQGFIYKEIGDKMSIGVTTVRTYVQNICAKMHVRSRLEAVARHRDVTPLAGGLLSPREREILELMVKGYLEKQIADDLKISPHTAHAHIRSIYEKLEVHSRAQAVAKYGGMA